VFLRSSRLTTISVSRKVEEDLRRTYPSVHFHFQRLYNPVDTTHFHDRDRPACAAHLRQRFGIPSEKRIAVFMAHRFQPKGLLHALKALGRAQSWHLIVAGRDRPGRFAKMAARCGALGRTHFVGPIMDTRPLLAGADCLLLPTYYDTCALVVLEAMSCGTPAITTRQNGAAELIEPAHSGFVLDSPADIDGAVHGLHALQMHGHSFHDAVVAGVAHLDWKNHVDRMEKILSRALGQA
jgi:UDP-glucose:(heptosyl)LPS alpha-1,3-glucosyltransferase